VSYVLIVRAVYPKGSSLTDEATEGEYEWVTGETYIHDSWYWDYGEPNNDGAEDYIEMIQSSGRWNDGEINGDFGIYSLNRHGFICEWDKKPDVEKKRSASPRRADTSDEGMLSIEYETAVEGAEYVLLVVKDDKSVDLLSPDNLLYIGQQAADSEVVTFSYPRSEEYPDAPAHIYGPDKNDVAADYLNGDVDGDGAVKAEDARLALRASVKLEPDIVEGTAAYQAADYNQDGEVKSEDARAILRVSVKLDPFG
ncbi:MAG: hypothetical protein IJL71_04940, partial [Oscillospiraceae bacterium]|nr:hypothetical protein [Oscillospiraceae bacterium]